MWQSVVCAAQGRGHSKNNLPCQDKVIAQHENGVHVIALADGAGSAKLSHFGAQCVVATTAQFLTDNFAECFTCTDGREVKRQLLETIRAALEQEASKHNCELRDLASTLLTVAVSDEHFILAHLGDGVVGYLDGSELKVASSPDNGEFSNETTFVTSQSALAALRLFKGELKNKCGFVLMSDGSEQSLYHKQSKSLSPALKTLMHLTCISAPEAMYQRVSTAISEILCAQTNDDCSLAILATDSASLPPLNELETKLRRDLLVIKDDPKAKRRLERMDTILEYAREPRTLKEISLAIQLKPKHTQKRIDKLMQLGFLVQQGERYQTYQAPQNEA